MKSRKLYYSLWDILFCFLVVVGVVQLYIHKDNIVSSFHSKKAEFIKEKHSEINKDLNKKSVTDKQNDYIKEQDAINNKDLKQKATKQSTNKKIRKKRNKHSSTKKISDKTNLVEKTKDIDLEKSFLNKEVDYNNIDWASLSTIFKVVGIVLIAFGLLKSLFNNKGSGNFVSFGVMLAGGVALIVSFFV